jgi:hypothetical protein
MSSFHALLGWLHLGGTAALILFAGARLAQPERDSAGRGVAIAAALLAGAALPLASAKGWWLDMPDRIMVPLVGGLALLLGLAGVRRHTGRLAALALAAFFLTLGLASVRNGGPLAGFMAGKAMLFGLVLALLPWEAAVRPRMALLLLAVLATAALGVHRDIPVF